MVSHPVQKALPDRQAYDTAFEGFTKDAGEYAVSVGIIDLDWFGRLNDKHGRAVGDVTLKFLENKLLEAFDAVGSVYRIGGDAFAVLWPGLEKEQAFMQLESFRQAFSGQQVVTVAEKEVQLELYFSAGVGAYPDDGTDPQSITNKVCEALYRAKVSGRNKTCLPREEKMVTKTSHYTQGQLMGLRRLAEREKLGEANLLREALNDLLKKYNAKS